MKKENDIKIVILSNSKKQSREMAYTLIADMQETIKEAFDNKIITEAADYYLTEINESLSGFKDLDSINAKGIVIYDKLKIDERVKELEDLTNANTIKYMYELVGV